MTNEIVLDESGLPLLDQFSADGFVDCTFRILKVFSTPEVYRLELGAAHRGERVGFRAIVRRGIRGGFDSAMNLVSDNVYRSAIEFHRTGPESDLMLKAIAGLYEVESHDLRMIDRFPFTAIALHQGDANMETHPIRIKLFGCDSDEEVARDEYFECFFNLDLPSGWVFWNEKDQDYRQPLLRGLSSK